MFCGGWFIATTGGESGGGSSTPEAKLKVFSSRGGRSPSTGFWTMGTAQAKSSCARTSLGDFFGCQLGWALSHTAQRAAVAALTLWWRTFVMKRTHSVDAWTPTTPRLIATAVRRSTSGTRTIGFIDRCPFPACITFVAHQSDADLTQVLVLGFWDMFGIRETVVTNAGPAPGWGRNRSEAEVRPLSENAMDSEDYPYPPHSVCKAESDNSSGATWQSSAGSTYWCAAP